MVVKGYGMHGQLLHQCCGRPQYFERLMNEENKRKRWLEEVEIVNKDVQSIKKDDMSAAMKRMQSGKVVELDDIPVEVW